MSVDAKRARWRTRSKPLIEQDTWFVSYETIMPSGTRHYARATRRFKSEAAASSSLMRWSSKTGGAQSPAR